MASLGEGLAILAPINYVHGMRKKKAAKKGSRDRRIHMLLSEEEYRLLLEICDEEGLTKSDVIRQLIRKENARYGGDKPMDPLIARRTSYDAD